jgi:hypothetical protein
VFLVLYLRWKERKASTASVASLANFALGNPLPPKYKIACWDSPNPLFREDGAALWKISNVYHPTQPDNSGEIISDERKMTQLQTERIGAYLYRITTDWSKIILLDGIRYVF